MRKFASVIALGAAAALLLSGCTPATPPTTAPPTDAPPADVGFPADSVIGVSLPQKTSENWVLAEALFNDGLRVAGYQPAVSFADGGDTEQQRTK